MSNNKVPIGCDFLPGIAKTMGIGYSSVRRLINKPGFPTPFGIAVSKNKRKFEYYNIESVKKFREQCKENGKFLPANKASIATIDRTVFAKFHANRKYRVTKLKSGQMVQRRVIQAPDRIGYYE